MLAVVEAAGGSIDRVARVTVFLADPDGWPVFNRVFAEVFGAHRPARAVVPVNPFHGGMLVEVDAIAVLDDDR
jgi:enamine deaminase RidA (YjgF/YER057c/UK114 family)